MTSSGSTTDRGTDGAGDGNVNPAGVSPPAFMGAGVSSAPTAGLRCTAGRRALPPPRSFLCWPWTRVGVPVGRSRNESRVCECQNCIQRLVCFFDFESSDDHLIPHVPLNDPGVRLAGTGVCLSSGENKSSGESIGVAMGCVGGWPWLPPSELGGPIGAGVICAALDGARWLRGERRGGRRGTELGGPIGAGVICAASSPPVWLGRERGDVLVSQRHRSNPSARSHKNNDNFELSRVISNRGKGLGASRSP